MGIKKTTRLSSIFGSSKFNSIAGVTISLAVPVVTVSDYEVTITPQADSGFIGDVWVDKATTGFSVYNSGSDDSTAFSYIVLRR